MSAPTSDVGGGGLLHSDCLKSNPDRVGRLNREVQFFKPDHLSLAIFHPHNFLARFLGDIFIGVIAEPDRQGVSFTVIKDSYFDHFSNFMKSSRSISQSRRIFSINPGPTTSPR